MNTTIDKKRNGIFTAPGTIRFERLLPGPIERVWAYLTEAEKRKKWLAGGAMEPFVGGQVELIFDNSNLIGIREDAPEKYKQHDDCTTQYGKIITWQPFDLLAYTWEGGSQVTFELIPKGDQVLLILTHRDLGQNTATLISVAAGWHTHTEILIDRLNDRKPLSFWARHAELEKIYLKELEA